MACFRPYGNLTLFFGLIFTPHSQVDIESPSITLEVDGQADFDMFRFLTDCFILFTAGSRVSDREQDSVDNYI